MENDMLKSHHEIAKRYYLFLIKSKKNFVYSDIIEKLRIYYKKNNDYFMPYILSWWRL